MRIETCRTSTAINKTRVVVFLTVWALCYHFMPPLSQSKVSTDIIPFWSQFSVRTRSRTKGAYSPSNIIITVMWWRLITNQVNHSHQSSQSGSFLQFQGNSSKVQSILSRANTWNMDFCLFEQNVRLPSNSPNKGFYDSNLCNSNFLEFEHFYNPPDSSN